MTSNAFSRGDVVLVEFPFSDGSGQKDRPALVIAGPSGLGDYAIAMISSEKQDDGVMLTGSDLASGKLDKNCFVRVRRLYTLKGTMILRTLGIIRPAALSRVLAVLCPTLGCKS